MILNFHFALQYVKNFWFHLQMDLSNIYNSMMSYLMFDFRKSHTKLFVQILQHVSSLTSWPFNDKNKVTFTLGAQIWNTRAQSLCNFCTSQLYCSSLQTEFSWKLRSEVIFLEISPAQPHCLARSSQTCMFPVWNGLTPILFSLRPF